MSIRPSVEQWYRAYAAELVRYATALVGPADAADLVADTFAGIIARGERHWITVREPRPYLYRAVTNAVRMDARSSARRVQRERVSATRDEYDGDLDAQPEILRSLLDLPVVERATIFFTYWADQPAAEVAGLLGISERSVKRHLARARDTLRKELS